MSSAIAGSAVKRLSVLVRAGGHGVVVPGTDVDVMSEHVAFTPDDERHLGVYLQVGEAVDDVHARLFQGA